MKSNAQRFKLWGFGAVVMAIYGATLCPGVGGGDSGELTTVAYSLGISHPPGYPLFTLIGNLFTFIPFGTVAWRVNMFTAVCGALAAMVLAKAVGEWTRSSRAGLVAAGLFAFSPLIWTYSTTAEVFSLNHLLLALLFLECVNLVRSTRPVKLTLRRGAFIFGLGVCNHPSFILVGIPLSVWALLTQPRGRRPLKEWLILAGFLSLGLLPYLYLPIMAHYRPWISWGDAGTWEGFWHHVLRMDYGTFQLASVKATGVGKVNFLGALSLYLSSLFRQTLGLGILLAIWGVVVKVREEGKKSLAAVTVVGFLLCLLVLCGGANLQFKTRLFRDVFSRFWQEPNLLVFVWIGLGFAWLEKKLKPRNVLAGGVVFLQLGLNYASQDQHDNWTIHRYAEAILEGLPRNALFLPQGDLHTYPIRYLQECEGFRRDVLTLPRGAMGYPWLKLLVEARFPEIDLPGKFYSDTTEEGSYSLQQFLDANYARFPIFLSPLTEWDDHRSWTGRYFMRPYGALEQVVSVDSKLERYGENYREQALSAIQNMRTALEDPALLKHRLRTWEEVAWGDDWNARSRLAYQLINSATSSSEADLKKRQLGNDLLQDLLKELQKAPLQLRQDLELLPFTSLDDKAPRAK